MTQVDLDDSATPQAETQAKQSSPNLWRDGFVPLLRRLHFTVGLLVGPFIAVAAATGFLYSVTPTLESFVYSNTITVPVGDAKIPVSEQVQAAQAEAGELALLNVQPSWSDDSATRVVFTDESLAEKQQRTVFVDPYNGDVIGNLVTHNDWLPIRAFFDNLHGNLLLGDLGSLYSELAASWLWVLILSGLGIWITRRVKARKLRRTLLPEPQAKGRRRLLSWHASIGVWVAVIALFLSATGLTWSTYAGGKISSARTELSWTTPTPDAEVDRSNAPVNGETVERVDSAARSAGFGERFVIEPGESDQAAWQVRERQWQWPYEGDVITVDPSDGSVIDRVDFADWPFMAKVAELGILFHMGILFGLANQLLLAAVALSLLAIVILGYRMWWQRRPRTREIKTPASQIALATMLLLAAVAAVLVPLLGISLLLFIVADTAVAVRQTRAKFEA